MTRQSSSLGDRSTLGVVNRLLYLLGRVLEKLTARRVRVIKYYFVAQPITTLARRHVAGSKTRIGAVAAGEPITAQFPRPASVIDKRFADGAMCFAAQQAGKLVAYLWIKQQSYIEDEVRCRYFLHPPERLVWDFDVYVAPEFRMSRAFARLWEASNEFLRERGYHWSISRISAFNAASLASHRRLGIVHLHTGTFLVAGPVQLALFSCRPFLHVAFGAASSPRLDFHAPPHDSNA